ncbi:hypothetical protein PVA45_08355 (plasmid) [Entomospira entomophila]|uniref:Uncharacterized protein n=1 Tax=Entomospira entomophila TaxID=2719988 RepID=A0A968GBW6_9SPIO|nr:hypothetical protein [Entomospira entomophilus]NIZ41530.1 hypothetical protein [Entomospira entomophilus]WDI36442.1 hypothetical protein PVA45_08355 [Entomospira entomophilus]
MKIHIRFRRGFYRRVTGRRQPNHRRLRKMLKSAGWYRMAEVYISEMPEFAYLNQIGNKEE